jgi:outer membrane beta-barrel protein
MTTKTIIAALLLVPSLAVAQQRRSALKDEPPVRHKQELRLKRFELAPTFEMTVQGDYKHTVSFGAKAEYHLTDQLSIGGMVFFGTGVDTALSEQIRESLLDTRMPNDPAPSRADFDDHLNTIPIHGGFGATYTPWFGKISMFQKVFVNFDFYVSGGFGFAVTKNDFGMDGCDPQVDGPGDDGALGTPDDLFNDPRNDCPHNSGFNPGLQVGGGLHVFVNKFIAIDISFRDYFFTDNPSGLDFDADLDVDSDDRRFLSHLFFGVGVSLYFPPKPKISR